MALLPILGQRPMVDFSIVLNGHDEVLQILDKEQSASDRWNQTQGSRSLLPSDSENPDVEAMAVGAGVNWVQKRRSGSPMDHCHKP